MSVRRNFLYNPMPWTIWGGSFAFGGFGVGYKKGIAFGGGLSQNTVMVRSQIEGYRFWGGSSRFFFCAISTSHGIHSLRAPYASFDHCSYHIGVI